MRRVVKIGGSLLLRSDLQHALAGWIESQHAAETLLVVGGGELVDAIRRLDRVHPLEPEQTHWLCVDLLQTTFQLCAGWFPAWQLIEDSASLAAGIQQGFSRSSPTLVAVRAFYNRDNDAGVPVDWRTTTDTIAAVLAIRVAADELVLLKSCEVDPQTSLPHLAQLGIVDEAFPLIAPNVKAIRVEGIPHR